MMVHNISNEKFSVDINSKGCELASIQSKQTRLEYMWEGDPAVWSSQAPVLFPAIGSFKDGVCQIKGKTFALPKHGIIRHNEDLVVKEHNVDSITYELLASDKTMQVYPFAFRFEIRFTLEGNTLEVHHRIENLGEETLPFALGGHPAFRYPLHEGEVYEDYYLEFEEEEYAERILLGDTGLISRQKRLVLDGEKELGLRGDLFEEDALIFTDLKSRSIALKSRKSSQVLRMEFQDFPYLGIWAKPQAPFVCIEPWQGMADREDTNGEFVKKEGLIHLEAAKSYEASYRIIVEE